MAAEPTSSLDPRMIRVWRTQEAVSLAVYLLILVPLLVFVHPAWLVIASVAVLALQLCALFVLPGLRYRRWRYDVTSTDVLVRSGLIVVKTTVIPMVRVQHVETKQGPILKANGLASVRVTTAGSSFEIPGLAAPEAEVLRDRVAVLARIAQEDV